MASRYSFPWQGGWTRPGGNAALEAGLVYAGDAVISAGAQLYLLASTLFSLGVYEEVGQPDGKAGAWQERITS